MEASQEPALEPELPKPTPVPKGDDENGELDVNPPPVRPLLMPPAPKPVVPVAGAAKCVQHQASCQPRVKQHRLHDGRSLARAS
jgi:hypothetical protein